MGKSDNLQRLEKEYDAACQTYHAYMQAATMAREKSERSRNRLMAVDPDNDRLKLPLREYALICTNPLISILHIFLGEENAPYRPPERPYSQPHLYFLAASLFLNQGTASVNHVFSVLKKQFRQRSMDQGCRS